MGNASKGEVGSVHPTPQRAQQDTTDSDGSDRKAGVSVLSPWEERKGGGVTG